MRCWARAGDPVLLLSGGQPEEQTFGDGFVESRPVANEEFTCQCVMLSKCFGFHLELCWICPRGKLTHGCSEAAQAFEMMDKVSGPQA